MERVFVELEPLHGLAQFSFCMKLGEKVRQCRWVAEGDFRFSERRDGEWYDFRQGTLIDALDDFVSYIEDQNEVWRFDRATLVVAESSEAFPFGDERSVGIRGAVESLLDETFNGPTLDDPSDLRLKRRA